MTGFYMFRLVIVVVMIITNHLIMHSRVFITIIKATASIIGVINGKWILLIILIVQVGYIDNDYKIMVV